MNYFSIPFYEYPLLLIMIPIVLTKPIYMDIKNLFKSLLEYEEYDES